LIRISPENIRETLAFLENKWRTLPTHLIFFYYFIYISLENQAYQGDKREGRIFSYAAIIAIVLACLGLFGLASYTAERRIKEIGIRKVLGASVSNLIHLLNRDYSLLVLIANVIAWPVGYYIMHRWLQDFAYRAGIAWWIFVLAGIMVFVITLVTISYQSIKAAITNPVDTLRYE
jgi:putative ABC transport system permease protein